MRRRPPRLERLGVRLAFLALFIQALIPFLLTVEIRAHAADPLHGSESLCLHDGGGASGGAPHQDCNLACCPLCSTLAASVAFGVAGQPAPQGPGFARIAPPPVRDDPAAAPAPLRLSYRSRAPPRLV
ncbi:MAG TPA: DUF2946 family protein [Stellaceae bacterium]|nr:DUF2946 family protein [Stellaceae bacterium]